MRGRAQTGRSTLRLRFARVRVDSNTEVHGWRKRRRRRASQARAGRFHSSEIVGRGRTILTAPATRNQSLAVIDTWRSAKGRLTLAPRWSFYPHRKINLNWTLAVVAGRDGKSR